MEPGADAVTVTLSADEALVLGDFLFRMSHARAFQGLVEDQAELRVLWNLEARLEPLTPAMAANYLELLTAARDALRDEPFDAE